ncbi:hypothetical protein IW261DRAFT_566247 [Armillaria novae-zelandiae]|uniref:Uncharacterized protein n=1 Tax=Armillaria novae-zelandiae TaxID=153914 RepID=A0AA39NYD1_9AGAR|nr:hypothetical protein IW261DRAFT_566247 [Armillaria novae-zelandiae]
MRPLQFVKLLIIVLPWLTRRTILGSNREKPAIPYADKHKLKFALEYLWKNSLRTKDALRGITACIIEYYRLLSRQLCPLFWSENPRAPTRTRLRYGTASH